MEKKMTIRQQSTADMTSVARNIRNAVVAPIVWLSEYYSGVLSRKITIRQTLLLLNAQAAFFVTAFSVGGSFVVRLLTVVWLIRSLLLCKKEL